MDVLWNLLFGCWHRRTSFPFTSRRKNFAGGPVSRTAPATYIVCLDCGKKMPYSWEEMKVLRGRKREAEKDAVAADGRGIVGWFSRRGWSSR